VADFWTIEQTPVLYNSLTWTQKLSVHVDRKKNIKKEETETNKRQCSLNSLQVHDP